MYNWRGTIGKTSAPDGSRVDIKGAIPDLDWLRLEQIIEMRQTWAGA